MYVMGMVKLEGIQKNRYALEDHVHDLFICLYSFSTEKFQSCARQNVLNRCLLSVFTSLMKPAAMLTKRHNTFTKWHG